MLGLPASTEVCKQLPKKSIYTKFDLKQTQRDHFDEDVARLNIVNVISSTTIPALAKGEGVECIYVIEVLLKNRIFDLKNIQLLTKLIPQKMVLALHFGNEIKLAVEHTKLFFSNWQNVNEYKISLHGLSLDTVWDNIVIAIGDINVEGGKTLKQQIQTDDAKSSLLKQIQRLESKARNEKQPRKKAGIVRKYTKVKKANIIKLMDRIKLSKEEKLLLKRLSARKYPDQVLEEDLKVFMILENESLVHGTKGKDGILAPRLTAMGEAYIASNPKLKNPSIWEDTKYIINTTISIIALIISLIALIK